MSSSSSEILPTPPCSLGGCVFSLSHKPRAGSYPRRGAGVCPADGRSTRGVTFCTRAAHDGRLRFSARALSGRLPCATSTASRPAARGPFCSVLIERKQHGCVRAGWPMSLALLACAREGVAGALSSRAQTLLAALRNSRGTIGPQPSSCCRPPCWRPPAMAWRRLRRFGLGQSSLRCGTCPGDGSGTCALWALATLFSPREGRGGCGRWRSCRAG